MIFLGTVVALAYGVEMVGFVRGLIQVLVSLVGIAILLAIKQGSAYGLRQAGSSATIAAGIAVVVLLAGGWFWLLLLQPALLKRKHRREDARVGQRAIGQRAGDR